MQIVFPLHFPPTRYKLGNAQKLNKNMASKATRRLLVAQLLTIPWPQNNFEIIRGLRAEAVLPQGTTWLYLWGSSRFRGFGAARSIAGRTPKGLGTVAEPFLNRALTFKRRRRWLLDHLCAGARTFLTSDGGLTG